MTTDTEYLVFVDWRDGPGGVHSFDKLPEAKEKAQSLAKMYQPKLDYRGLPYCHGVKLIKVTRKEMEF